VANQPRGGSDGQRQRKREGEKSEHTNLEGHSCNYRAEKGPGHWRENTNRYDYPGVQRRHLAGRIADSRRLPPHRLSRVKPQWMLAEPAPRTAQVSSSVANPRTCRQLRTDVRSSTRREAGRSARRIPQDVPTIRRHALGRRAFPNKCPSFSRHEV
jgi:hypothetical protein